MTVVILTYCSLDTVHNSSAVTVLIHTYFTLLHTSSLSWYGQVVLPTFNQSLDDLQVVAKHSTVVMVTVVHQEF